MEQFLMRTVCLWVASLSLLALPAFGDAIFTVGNNPQPNEQNVLFSTNQSAATVFGTTNQSGDTVQFTSTTDTLVTTANGQSNLTALDGLINNVTITVPGFTFLDLILNPRADNQTPSGVTTVTVLTNNGTFTYTYPGDLSSGNNFLTITTINSQTISSVTVDSVGGFETDRQNRISGVGNPITAIPEPSTMGLMGGALAIIGFAFRRRLS